MTANQPQPPDPFAAYLLAEINDRLNQMHANTEYAQRAHILDALMPIERRDDTLRMLALREAQRGEGQS